MVPQPIAQLFLKSAQLSEEILKRECLKMQRWFFQKKKSYEAEMKVEM